MTSYRDPSFQDRVGRAAQARQKALDNLRSRPPVDEAALAERQARRLKREADQAERRAAKQAAEQSAREAKAAAEQSAREAEAADTAARLAAAPVVLTEAEKKQARDARYAARKSRK